MTTMADRRFYGTRINTASPFELVVLSRGYYSMKRVATEMGLFGEEWVIRNNRIKKEGITYIFFSIHDNSDKLRGAYFRKVHWK